jgi:hypothetical protein
MKISTKADLPAFLYLLPFKNNKHFKFGISSSGFNRIENLNSIYEIDINKSKIYVTENEKLIKYIEKEIKVLFPDNERIYRGKDGWTEIRDIKIFDKVLELLNTRPKFVNLKSYQLVSLLNKGHSDFPNKEPEKKSNSIQRNDSHYFLYYFIVHNRNKIDNLYFDENQNVVIQFKFHYDVSSSILSGVLSKLHFYTSTIGGDRNTYTLYLKFVSSERVLAMLSMYLKFDIKKLDKEYTKKQLIYIKKRSRKKYMKMIAMDSKIAFTNLITGRRILLNISTVFDGLDYTIFYGSGYCDFKYADDSKRRFFLTDYKDLIKPGSGSGYCFDSEKELIEELRSCDYGYHQEKNDGLVMYLKPEYHDLFDFLRSYHGAGSAIEGDSPTPYNWDDHKYPRSL